MGPHKQGAGRQEEVGVQFAVTRSTPIWKVEQMRRERGSVPCETQQDGPSGSLLLQSEGLWGDDAHSAGVPQSQGAQSTDGPTSAKPEAGVGALGRNPQWMTGKRCWGRGTLMGLTTGTMPTRAWSAPPAQTHRHPNIPEGQPSNEAMLTSERSQLQPAALTEGPAPGLPSSLHMP